MKLRQYQHLAIDEVRLKFYNGAKRVLLVSPTGSGKTVMFAHITEQAIAKGRRVFILVHRMELVQQVSDKLTEFNVEHGFICRGRTPDPVQLVQVCMVQTLVKRLAKYAEPDLIICDEAHHAPAGSWKKVTDHYAGSKVLGVTATPERLDGKGLKDTFECLVRGPEVFDLIAQGFLAKPRYFAPTGFDPEAQGIKKRGGDYDKEALETAVLKSTITGDAVKHYRKIADGQPAVVFCVTIEHAKRVAAEFSAEGYNFKVIDGTLEASERKQLVKDLGEGRINGLVSCEIISEGFDLPIVTAAILLRPTQSLSLYLQQVGRVLRPSPGKDHAIILDHVGNIHRHGVAEAYRDWSLEGAVWRKKREAKVLKNRQCPKCFCIHEPAKFCPECGHEYKVEQRKLKTIDGELVEFTDLGERPIELSALRDLVLERTDEELSALKEKYPHRNFPGCLAMTKFWNAILEPDPIRREELCEELLELEQGLRKASDKREVGMARTYTELLKLGQQRGYRAPAGWARHVLAARSS
jgi:superfamily II DNA or RNA helicase